MRLQTLAANILLPTVVAITILALWVWVTGSTAMSIPTVIGLAIAAGAIASLVEKAVHRARVRRGRPQRRAHARPQPAKTPRGTV